MNSAATLLFSVGFSLVTDLAQGQEPAPPVALPREAIFVSDLHLGLGRNGTEEWDPMEDFRWHAEFRAFLGYLDRDLGKPVDLVVLGDFLELWQSDTDDCPGDKDRDYGCSREQALHRIKRVTQAHKELFSDLSGFIRTGENTLTIVPGNHDVALLLPEGADELRKAFDEDVRTRVAIPPSALWIAPDKSVAAEHGQQIGSDPNRFENWPHQPWHTPKPNELYLVQSWGEAFVQALFNSLEKEFQIIDNFSGRLEALKYVKASSTGKEELATAGRVLRFLLFQQSWRQFKGVLATENGMPVWDVKATQKAMDSSAKRWESLVKAMPDETVRAYADATAPEDLAKFSEEEIITVCNAIHIAKTCPPGDAPGCYCRRPADGKLSAVGESIATSINKKLTGRIFEDYFKQDLASRASDWSGMAYVYGHTHEPRTGFQPYEGAPVVFNDGAWQRTTSIEGLQALQKARGWSDAELLKQARPEDLPACYPFVRLTTQPDRDRSPRDLSLLYWNYRADGATCVTKGQCQYRFLAGADEKC